MTDPTMTDVRVPDPSFMENYDTGGDYTPPPQPKEESKGRMTYVKFTGQAPSLEKIKTRDKEGNPLKTADGYFKAIIEDIRLVESGYLISQTHLSTAQYRKFKDGAPTGELRSASNFIDYLHANGIDTKQLKPSTVEEYESYIQSTADRQFQLTGDWSAWDKDSQTDVARKWEEFPMLYVADDGSFSIDPATGKATGNRQTFIEKDGKKFWARLSVKRWISVL